MKRLSFVLAAALALSACASNSAGEYRTLRLEHGDAFTTHVALRIACEEFEETGVIDRAWLAEHLTPDAESFPESVPDLKDRIARETPAFCAMVEDLVEATLADFLERPVDYASPDFSFDRGGLEVVERDTRKSVLELHVDRTPVTPAGALATEYLTVRLGPEHARGFDFEGQDASRFRELFAAWLFTAEPDQEARLRKLLVHEADAVCRSAGVTPEQAEANRCRYSAGFFIYGGQTSLEPLGLSVGVALESGNVSTERLLLSYFHELGHCLIADEWGLLSRISICWFRNYPQDVSVNENACEVLAHAALEHFLATRLAGLSKGWLKRDITLRRVNLTAQQKRRYVSLFRGEQLEDLPDQTVAVDVVRARYQSLQEKLRLVLDAVGPRRFIPTVARLETPHDVDALLATLDTRPASRPSAP